MSRIDPNEFSPQIHSNSEFSPQIHSNNDQFTPLIQTNGRQNEPACCKSSWCTKILIAIIVLGGLLFLLFWISFAPKWPVFTVEEGAIHGYNVTSNYHLNGAFNFVVSASNPNANMSLNYQKIDIKAYHGGQVVGYDEVRSFLQPNGNVTEFKFGGLGFDLPLFEAPGEIDLMLEINGTLSFNIDLVNLVQFTFSAKCFPVVIYFDSTRGFDRRSCYLDIN